MEFEDFDAALEAHLGHPIPPELARRFIDHLSLAYLIYAHLTIESAQLRDRIPSAPFGLSVEDYEKAVAAAIDSKVKLTEFPQALIVLYGQMPDDELDELNLHYMIELQNSEGNRDHQIRLYFAIREQNRELRRRKAAKQN